MAMSIRVLHLFLATGFISRGIVQIAASRASGGIWYDAFGGGVAICMGIVFAVTGWRSRRTP